MGDNCKLTIHLIIRLNECFVNEDEIKESLLVDHRHSLHSLGKTIIFKCYQTAVLCLIQYGNIIDRLSFKGYF